MSKKVVSIGEGAWPTGAFVPVSGIYRVSHAEHCLPLEVTLLRGQSFPRCEACAFQVLFRLRRRLDSVQSLSRFSVELYQLPVVGTVRRAS